MNAYILGAAAPTLVPPKHTTVEKIHRGIKMGKDYVAITCTMNSYNCACGTISGLSWIKNGMPAYIPWTEELEKHKVQIINEWITWLRNSTGFNRSYFIFADNVKIVSGWKWNSSLKAILKEIYENPDLYKAKVWNSPVMDNVHYGKDMNPGRVSILIPNETNIYTQEDIERVKKKNDLLGINLWTS